MADSALTSTPALPAPGTDGPLALLLGATFTVTPLEEPLRFWLAELSLPHRLEFAPYQQIVSSLIDPNGVYSRQGSGLGVVLVRLEDLAEDEAELPAHVTELIHALKGAASRRTAPLLVLLCPDSTRFLETEERQALARVSRDLVQRELAAVPNLLFIAGEAVIARYEVTEVDDPLADRAGHVPYRQPFFVGLATQIVRTLVALERRPPKLVAVDCDNTLWTGVCGEDGPGGVVVDKGRRVLQHVVAAQREHGLLLAVTSKNNERDVDETFEAHPDMPLRLTDFVARRINWSPKSGNLAEIAAELNLGLDSFVLLDDDAKECAEIRRECPQVETIQIPGSSAQLPHFLQHLWLFDHVQPVTEEDRKRSQLYADESARDRFAQQAGGLEEFLAGLRLEVVFAPVTTETLPRAAQITQRTNQMNMALVRFTEGELAGALSREDENAFTVSVSDRFGSYGLVGLVLYRFEDESLLVSGFLLSCRALGRGVEHRMLAHAAEIAERAGKRNVRIVFAKGPRNQPARDLLASVARVDLPESGTVTLPAEVLTRLTYHPHPQAPKRVVAPVLTASDANIGVKPGPVRIDYERIAKTLDSAAKISLAIAGKRRQRQQAPRRIKNRPQTKLERGLAAIWCELLGLDEVGTDEDFFDLGGHSLLAVQLLSRIHRDLHVELPDSVIYAEKLRIENLARQIELQQLGVVHEEDYEQLIAEIESLSDEEVAALLAEEDGRV